MSEMDKGAAYIAKGIAAQAKMFRIMGWVLIVVGIPLLLLLGLGLVPIAIGCLCLGMARRLGRREAIEEGMDGIAAVGASLARRAKS